MLVVILSSTLAFFSTEIDDFFALIFLMAAASSREEKIAVSCGKYAGLLIICAASALAASYISKIPSYFVGFLGLIPIALAVKEIFFSKKENAKSDEEKSLADKKEFLDKKSIMVFLATVLVTISAGFDNFAIYIPFFTTLKGFDFVLLAIVFIILQALFCLGAALIVNQNAVKKVLEKKKNLFTGLLFFALGIYIMLKNKTFAWIFGI